MATTVLEQSLCFLFIFLPCVFDIDWKLFRIINVAIFFKNQNIKKGQASVSICCFLFVCSSDVLLLMVPSVFWKSFTIYLSGCCPRIFLGRLEWEHARGTMTSVTLSIIYTQPFMLYSVRFSPSKKLYDRSTLWIEFTYISISSIFFWGIHWHSRGKMMFVLSIIDVQNNPTSTLHLPLSFTVVSYAHRLFTPTTWFGVVHHYRSEWSDRSES